MTGLALVLGLGAAEATTPVPKSTETVPTPTVGVALKESDVTLAPVVAPTASTPGKSVPAKLPVVAPETKTATKTAPVALTPIVAPDVSTKAKGAPTPLTPVMTPLVKLPAKESTVPLAPVPAPVVKAPVKDAGIALAPVATPHVSAPVKDKSLSLAPVVAPRIDVPVKDKALTLGTVTTPNIHLPVKDVSVPLGAVPVPSVDLTVKQLPHKPVIALTVPQVKLALPPVVPMTKVRSTQTKVFFKVGRESSRNIYVRGGNAYVTIVSPIQQCVPLEVSVETGPELSCRPQAKQRQCFERSSLRKFGPGDKIVAFANGERVVHAVCVDDTGSEHPASRIDKSERVASDFAGELYRCVAGTRLKVKVGEATPTGADFSRSEGFVCAKGEALYHDPKPMELAGATMLAGATSICFDGGVGDGY